MRLQVYVVKSVTNEQKEWSARLRAVGHRVHFSLDNPFRKAEVCDAFIYDGDNKAIFDAYDADGIPLFEDSMLEENIDKRTHVAKPKKKKAAARKTPSDIVKEEIEKAVDVNTGGTGVIPEPTEPPEAA